MKGRVEDGHMGDAREKGFAGLNTLQVGWVVEGGQLTVFSNDLFDGIIDDGRCRDGFTSMDDPVADGGNILICFDDTEFIMGQETDEFCNSLLNGFPVCRPAMDIAPVVPVFQSGGLKT